MIAEIIATLGLIVDWVDEHPDLVKKLAAGLRSLLDGHEAGVNVEAMRGLAAGMAAARANAVQEFVRRQKAAGK